jgi:phosphoribosylamine---glycine ligase
MNVLIIGSGGREHALAWKISQSKQLEKLYISPGNPGTKNCGINIELGNDPNAILEFCKKINIDLVVVGPEQPLVNGLADVLRKGGIKVFGPGGRAAEIEGHKSFAKHLMMKYQIPTAAYKEFNSTELSEALEYLRNTSYPTVIKTDGLAAGKGVVICEKFSDAENSLNDIFVKKIFGSAGSKVIVEEFLQGEEASILAVTDGDEYVLLPSSQDHKRIGENDTGKNTGGMGAYSPAPIISASLIREIDNLIIKPTLEALRKEGRKFIGCLYAGLMITNAGPKVVEFNCRFGDPETQAVLPLLQGDFLKLLYSAADEKIDKSSVNYSGGTAICVVAVSGGYPGNYSKGIEISGLQNIDSKQIVVFHAGTIEKDNKIFTSGGRVLGVTAILEENDLQKARTLVYNEVKSIKYDGIYFRRDIGLKAFKNKS